LKRSLLPFLRCPNCDSDDLVLEVFEEDDQGVLNGRIVSPDCNQWYRIDGAVVDLLPVGLRNGNRYDRFAARYGLAIHAGTREQSPLDAQKSQMTFFAEEAKVYERDITNSVFYQVSFRLCMLQWIHRLPTAQVVLDIGGGTGRQAIPLAKSGHVVVSCDISEEMLRIARDKARKEGLDGRTNFILADATALPLRDNVFDAVICSSTLHHVPSPEGTITHASRVLKRGGRWYSYDPNDSPARFVFDWAMRLKKLYEEEASDNHMLNGTDLSKWCEGAGLKVDIRYSTYILPHLINSLGTQAAYAILKGTDLCFQHLPFFKKFGGIIISEGMKA